MRMILVPFTLLLCFAFAGCKEEHVATQTYRLEHVERILIYRPTHLGLEVRLQPDGPSVLKEYHLFGDPVVYVDVPLEKPRHATLQRRTRERFVGGMLVRRETYDYLELHVRSMADLEYVSAPEHSTRAELVDD